jgi:hypothetical protein
MDEKFLAFKPRKHLQQIGGVLIFVSAVSGFNINLSEVQLITA